MIGTLLQNRYKILQELGQGGFGQTYLAEDTNLNKIRVVKKLQPQSTDPDVLVVARRLFKNESDVLNMLEKKHPQIPELLDRFEENQEFYLVQEYIEGETLLVELSRGPMSEAQVKQLLIDILQPLSLVHDQNIIHRDIKPSNLIRRKSDNQIYLIDFGAVKQIFTATSQPQNTQNPNPTTIAIGTPGYMPEEQEKGHPRLASDIYAVGIVGIIALTGRLPTTRDPKTLQVLWKKPASVSDEFAAILNKMIAKEADNRYQKASEVLAALTPTQVSLNPVTSSGQLVKKTNLAILIPASILAFALGIGGAFFLRDRFFAPEPAPPPPPGAL
jgi:serine/threonine protein kinase